jgi:hypothetical protein
MQFNDVKLRDSLLLLLNHILGQVIVIFYASLKEGLRIKLERKKTEEKGLNRRKRDNKKRNRGEKCGRSMKSDAATSVCSPLRQNAPNCW